MKTIRHPQGWPRRFRRSPIIDSKRMNVTFAQLSTKCPNRGGRRLAQMFAVTLFVLFLTAAPALADEVRIGQVVTTLTNSRANPELKLSTLASQDPVAPGTRGSTQNGPANGNQGGQKSDQGVNGGVNVSGVAITNEGASLGVDIVEEGEVEGTICDCGEIFVAGGAFPKWPFLFLGAVPLVFINNCDDCDKQSSSPTPTPTPTPPSNPTPTPTPPSEVPEPASLLLFGTGLAAFGAGLRRRYAKTKLSKQTNAREEE